MLHQVGKFTPFTNCIVNLRLYNSFRCWDIFTIKCLLLTKSILEKQIRKFYINLLAFTILGNISFIHLKKSNLYKYVSRQNQDSYIIVDDRGLGSFGIKGETTQ